MKISSIIICLLLIILGIFGIVCLVSQNNQRTGGYLAATITNTSSSVGVADTLVVSINSGLQYFKGTNLGPTRIFCYYNNTTTLVTAGLNSGEVINPIGSSTLPYIENTDPNKLAKAMHCNAPDGTSTLAILKYSNQ